MATYLDTYYRRTLARDEPRPALAGERSADVAVVGGGLAGLSLALELARRGRKIVLLEAERIAWGASGRNGGFVGPGYSAGLDRIERVVGRDDARALYLMSMEGVEIVAERLRELAIADAGKTHGILRALRYDGEAQLKATQERMARDFGRHLLFKSREEVRETLVSPKYHQGLYDAASFHFHPLNYATALAAEIERLGGAIHEASPVVAAALDEPTKTLRTPSGAVSATDVVVATGGYTGALVPALARSFIPIATYVLLTEPAKEAIAGAIRTSAGVADDRRANDYYRLVDDGVRILWGGKITTRTSEPRHLAELLRRNIVSTYPQLASIKVALAWSGLMSYARHLMPMIGRLSPGVWYCTGFGGHGMNTTAIGGRVVAEAIAGESDRYRRFEPFGLVWNGGPFGVAAVQATYWRYRAMDAWRERRNR
jgi:glycine/D-amino acid oxidase-like deaminating enzyme